MLVVAAKYAGPSFVPTVAALLAWWSWKQKGLEEMFVRLGIALFSLIVSGFIAIIMMDKQKQQQAGKGLHLRDVSWSEAGIHSSCPGLRPRT